MTCRWEQKPGCAFYIDDAGYGRGHVITVGGRYFAFVGRGVGTQSAFGAGIGGFDTDDAAKRAVEREVESAGPVFGWRLYSDDSYAYCNEEGFIFGAVHLLCGKYCAALKHSDGRGDGIGQFDTSGDARRCVERAVLDGRRY